MSGYDLLFCVLSLGTLAFAIGALFLPSLSGAVFSLMGLFFNVAGLFLLLGAEFLAFVLVLVYVGAVALLFLFMVMTLENRKKISLKRSKGALTVGGILFIELVLFLTLHFKGLQGLPLALKKGPSNIHAIGHVLYTTYWPPFHQTGLVLLAALVGVLALALRGKNNTIKRRPLPKAAERLTLKEVPLRRGIDT